MRRPRFYRTLTETPLFDSLPHARESDVATSHEAVPRPDVLNPQCVQMLIAYRSGRALIDEEAGRLAGLIDGHQRCSDLRAFGFISRTGDRGPTQRGSSAFRCAITQRGLDFLKDNRL